MQFNLSTGLKLPLCKYLHMQFTTVNAIMNHHKKSRVILAISALLLSAGAFGFENGMFTKVSGSGAIPTVMTFSKDNDGNYSVLEYKEPMDGKGPIFLFERILAKHKELIYIIMAVN